MANLARLGIAQVLQSDLIVRDGAAFLGLFSQKPSKDKMEAKKDARHFLKKDARHFLRGVEGSI